MAEKKTTTDHAAEAVNVITQAANAATKSIANAAESAAKLIANNAESAAKVVANAEAAALRVANVKGPDDHDLLIRIETRMEGLKADIKELKDGTSKRIDELEVGKLDSHDSYTALYKDSIDTIHKDFEDRIRSNEKNIIRIMTFGTLLVLLAGVVEVFLNLLIKNGKL